MTETVPCQICQEPLEVWPAENPERAICEECCDSEKEKATSTGTSEKKGDTNANSASNWLLSTILTIESNPEWDFEAEIAVNCLGFRILPKNSGLAMTEPVAFADCLPYNAHLLGFYRVFRAIPLIFSEEVKIQYPLGV